MENECRHEFQTISYKMCCSVFSSFRNSPDAIILDIIVIFIINLLAKAFHSNTLKKSSQYPKKDILTSFKAKNLDVIQLVKLKPCLFIRAQIKQLFVCTQKTTEGNRKPKSSKNVWTPVIKTRHQDVFRHVWLVLNPTEKTELWVHLPWGLLGHFPSTRATLQEWKAHPTPKKKNNGIPKPTSDQYAPVEGQSLLSTAFGSLKCWPNTQRTEALLGLHLPTGWIAADHLHIEGGSVPLFIGGQKRVTEGVLTNLISWKISKAQEHWQTSIGQKTL